MVVVEVDVVQVVESDQVADIRHPGIAAVYIRDVGALRPALGQGDSIHAGLQGRVGECQSAGLIGRCPADIQHDFIGQAGIMDRDGCNKGFHQLIGRHGRIKMGYG